MVPPFESNGLLPQGIHSTSWQTLVERFGRNEWRRSLLDGLERALGNLARAGCRTVYLDGSFVTNKPYPNDYDGCWDLRGVRLGQVDPVLLDFRHPRSAQKEKYKGELFIAEFPADPSGETFLDFFQTDKETGERKGIVRLSLEEFR